MYEVSISPVGIDQEHLAQVTEAVHKQIQELKDAGKWNHGISFFGNFYFYLPHTDEKTPGMNNYRRLYKDTEERKRPFKDHVSSGGKYSEVFLQQTPEEFFQTIDTIIEEEKIDPEQIKHLQTEIEKAASQELRLQKQEELYDLATPVFIRLLAMGYKQSPDLIV